jgi:hypothetical protein
MGGHPSSGLLAGRDDHVLDVGQLRREPREGGQTDRPGAGVVERAAVVADAQRTITAERGYE